MDVRFAVRLPLDVRSVPFARALIRQALEHVSVVPDVVDDLALALTEACANVVEHAAVDDDYEVQVSLDGDLCRISVLDRGAGLDPEAVGTPSGSLLEGGRGLFLMRDRVDVLRSERDPDGRHRVVLEKRLVTTPVLPVVRA